MLYLAICEMNLDMSLLGEDPGEWDGDQVTQDIGGKDDHHWEGINREHAFQHEGQDDPYEPNYFVTKLEQQDRSEPERCSYT